MTVPPPPAISVVVMGYRNEATIVAAVRSLLESRATEPFEVVVVVSGGDGSAAAVRAAFPELTVIDVEDRLLPGGARNRGVEACRGRVIAFLAADCVARPGWIDARLAAHRAGHPVVAGSVTSADPQRPAAWAHTFDLYCARLPGRPAGTVAPGDPAGHGLSFDRTVLDATGPFDETVAIGEDSELASRLPALGIAIWFEPRIVTAHCGPQGVGALVRDRYRRGRAAGAAAAEPPGARAAVADWATTLLWVLRTGWRNAAGERGRFLAAVPWVVVGRTAGAVGRARRRSLRSGTSGRCAR